MRTTRTRTTLAALAALPLLAALAVPAAAAAAPTVYQGQFTDIRAEGCSPSEPDWQASGSWRFVDRGAMATVSFNIFLDGRHHVAFGGALPQMEEKPMGALAAVQFPTGAGLLTVSVFNDEMTYAFTDGYTALDGSFTCESLTYVGSVS
jgi:hypothetical protein